MDDNNNDDDESSTTNNNNNSHVNNDHHHHHITTTNLFVPLNSIETIQRSLTIYLQSGTVRTFIKLALFFVIPATAILLTIVYYVMRQINNSNNDSDDNDNDKNFSDLVWNYITILMSQSLLQTTLGAISEGAIAVAVAELYLQRHPRWYYCIQKATSKALTLVCCGFIVGLLILGGYWCFYFPGLLLKINFMVVTPVIILEDEFYILSAMGRSWDLIHNGNKWYVFKCWMGLDILYLIVNLILRSLLKEDNDDNHPYFSLSFHLLKMIPQTMIVPLFGILKTVIYINLLIEQENTNYDQFEQQIDQGLLLSMTPDHNNGNGNGGISRVPLLFGENSNNNNHNLDFNSNNTIGSEGGRGRRDDDVEISFDNSTTTSSTIFPNINNNNNNNEFQTLHDAFMNVARARSVSTSSSYSTVEEEEGDVGGGESSTHTSMESFMTAPTGGGITATAAATTTTSSSSQQQNREENEEV